MFFNLQLFGIFLRKNRYLCAIQSFKKNTVPAMTTEEKVNKLTAKVSVMTDKSYRTDERLDQAERDIILICRQLLGIKRLIISSITAVLLGLITGLLL